MAAFIFIVEVFVILFVLFFGFLFAAFVIGIIFFSLKRRKKIILAWQQISGEVGLPMPNPQKAEMEGIYNKCRVKIAIGVRRSGSGENSHTEFYTYCTTDFPNSLRLGLNIDSRHGFFSKVLSANQMTLGSEDFDDNFRVKCYNQGVLRQLLLSEMPSQMTQNLMGDLMFTKNSGLIVEITDQKVYMEKSGQVHDLQTIKQMLDMTSFLSQRFQFARLKLPLEDWEKNLLIAWQNLANELNLTLDSANFTIQGYYKSFYLKAELLSGVEKWQTKIEFKFPNSLMAGLQIMPDNALHKAMAWLGAQDIETGNKDFDGAFIVKAQNVSYAKHILTNDLQIQLLGLKSQAADIKISDTDISLMIDGILSDGKILKSYFQAVVATAEMLKR